MATADQSPVLQLPSFVSPLPVDQWAPLRRPLSPVTSHYRPFSTYSTSPILQTPPITKSRSSSFIRSSASFAMGFNFKNGAKGKEKEQEPGRARKSSEIADAAKNSRPESPIKSVVSPIKNSPNRPSSPHGFFSLHKGLKKKRSLASLLSPPLEPSQSTPSTPLKSVSASSSDPSASSSSNPKPSDHGDTTPKPVPQLSSWERHSRANKFVRKNNWINSHSMKHHPYRGEVAYMQAYDPILLQNDHYTDILLRRLNPTSHPTFYDFGEMEPLSILDLGCGPGHWLLEASNTWEFSSITGIDIVDVRLPEIRNRDNIIFVRANFIKYPLPFPEKSFDLVRMANLSLCIPYDKWEFVISEVFRVLTIEGRLELIDDQLFFPYAPSTPTDSPSTSTAAPAPSAAPPNISKGVSFFDLDRDLDRRDPEDDDVTLQDSTEDDSSLHTESTLIHDGYTSASSKDELPQPRIIQNLDTSRPPSDTSEVFSTDDPETPTSTTTIRTNDTVRPSHWNRKMAASRNLETVFSDMLITKYGIHTRPSDFVPEIIRRFFGNCKKLHSFHIKLAPRDAHTGFGNLSRVSTSSTGSDGSDKAKALFEHGLEKLNDLARPWLSEKEQRWKTKVEKVHDKLEKAAVVGVHVRSRSFEDAVVVDMHVPDTHVPEGLSKKAAGRLGLAIDEAMTGDSQKPKNKILSPIQERPSTSSGIQRQLSKRNKSPPRHPPDKDSSTRHIPRAEVAGVEASGEDPNPPESQKNISAKAANRLGISYSALAVAAAASRRPQSSSSSLSPFSTPSQSPGIIVWPYTYIALSPTELEMHACKFVHTLIGWKASLADFIQTFKDENGDEVADDADFQQAIWDYECFRRRRFHWPSEIPELDAVSDYHSHHDHKSTSEPDAIQTTYSTIPASSPFWKPTSELPYKIYRRRDLIHLRTIRVFEAIKDEFGLLKFVQPPS